MINAPNTPLKGGAKLKFSFGFGKFINRKMLISRRGSYSDIKRAQIQGAKIAKKLKPNTHVKSLFHHGMGFMGRVSGEGFLGAVSQDGIMGVEFSGQLMGWV